MFSDRRVRTSLLAIATDVLLTVLKVALALITGSAALEADAFHSATDLIVSIVLLVGILVRIQQERNNSESKSLLGKYIEPVLAIVVAIIILYAPYEIISSIGEKENQIIENLPIGILGTLVVIAIVLFISKFKLFVGRETESIGLEADGYHSMVDVFTSIAVLISLLGYMVGVNLDEVIAVVIAIMIAVTGIELLISGVNSLVKHSEFDQISVYEFFGDVFRSLVRKYRFTHDVRAFVFGLYRKKLLIFSLCVLVFGFSGFKTVPVGYIGKKVNLGAVSQEVLSPGLHYVLPWPFGSLRVYENGTLYAADFGVRAEMLVLGKERIWSEIKEKSLRKEDAKYFVTGDEQLVDMSFSVLYKMIDSPGVYNGVYSHNSLVKEVSTYTFNQFTLSNSLDQLLSGDRKKLEIELVSLIQAELNTLVPGIHVVDVQVQTYRLPSLVIAAYRDVINAQQEKQQNINRAVADQLRALPLSRAEYIEAIALAESMSVETVLHAEGNIAQISELSRVQASHRAGFEFNAYLNTVDAALAGKSITIRDYRLLNSDLRLWKSETE